MAWKARVETSSRLRRRNDMLEVQMCCKQLASCECSVGRDGHSDSTKRGLITPRGKSFRPTRSTRELFQELPIDSRVSVSVVDMCCAHYYLGCGIAGDAEPLMWQFWNVTNSSPARAAHCRLLT
jgi:hypothetical protein